MTDTVTSSTTPIPTKDTFYEYLIFWVGQIFSLLGSTILQYVLIWWVVVTYENASLLSIAYLLGVGVQAIFFPVAGVLADKMNRKWILGISDALQALGAVGLLITFFMFDNNFLSPDTMIVWIFALISFRGIASAFHAPTGRAIIPLMVPEHQLSRLNGLQYTFLGMINIVGPALGALFYSYFDMTLIIFIDIFTFFLAVIPLFLIEIPSIDNNGDGIEEEETGNGNQFLTDFNEGLKIFKSTNGLIPLLSLFCLIYLFEIPIIVLGPIFVYTVHSGTLQDLTFVVIASQIGLFLMSTIFFAKASSPLLNRKRATIIVIALYIQIFGYFIQLTAQIGVFWWMAIGSFIFGATLPISDALYRTILQVAVPADKQGRVVALSASIIGGIMAIGTLLVGPLAEAIGVFELFMVSIILAFISITVLYFTTNLRCLDNLNGYYNSQEDPIIEETITPITN